MPEYPPRYVHTAIAAVQNQAISPDEVASIIVEQCTQSVADISQHEGQTMSYEGDTPGLESFLWPFWGEFVRLACEDAAIHDRLAQILVALKAKDGEGCDGWRVWGEIRTWSDLALFRPQCREAMNGPTASSEGQALAEKSPRARAILAGEPPSDDPAERAWATARQEWLNINVFLAKLWALDVVDEHFYGITTMRMNLECLTLSSTTSPVDAREGPSETGNPPELDIVVAATWMKIAGAKMYVCREVLGPKGNADWDDKRGCPGGSGGKWDGVDGYHPDRWAHWKQIFSEIAQGSWRADVVATAQATVEAMNEIERATAAA